MASITNTIYEIVRSHNGIKCVDIANEIHTPINHISGMLSALKHLDKVYNCDAKWYAANSIHDIKQTLNDLHESLDMPLGEWAEGYVNALNNYNIINDDELDELIEYIKTSK